MKAILTRFGMNVSQPTTNRTVMETSTCRFILHENGILYLYIHDDLSIDGSEAQQMVHDALSIEHSGQTRLLISIGANDELSFAAQRVFASAKGFTRVAFMTRNRLQAEVGQFLVTMMRALKSSYEFKLFYGMSDAEAWLLRP